MVRVHCIVLFPYYIQVEARAVVKSWLVEWPGYGEG